MTPTKIFILACIFWISIEIIIGVLLVKSRRGKVSLGIKFKKRRYFFLLSFIPFAYLITAIFFGYKYFLYFIFGGVWGMIGEILFSALWDIFFDKKLYEYQEDVIAAKYTSLLNFFPWAMVAMLYLILAGFVNYMSLSPLIGGTNKMPFYILFFLSVAISFFVVILIFSIYSLITFKRSRLNLPFSIPRYFLFISPFLVGFLVLILFRSVAFLYLFFLFMFLGVAGEYTFGRVCRRIFGHRLWTYNVLKIGKGQTSFAALIPWAFGGIYFLTLASLLGFYN